jgi:hypothetical protein
MFFPWLLLVLLVFSAPLAVVADGPVVHGLIAAAAAGSIAIIGLRIRPGEAGFLSAVIRPIAYVAAVPAFWMIVQVMPLQTPGLAHSVWTSATAALGFPLAQTISIDPGATLIVLVRYLSTIAIALTAAAVSIDRWRAQRILLVLVAATTVIALMTFAAKSGLFPFIASEKASEQFGFISTAIAGLGVILSLAAALHTIGQRMSRSEHTKLNPRWLIFAACLIAFALCCLTTITVGTSQTYFAVVCGIATLIVATAIRRYDIGPWGIAAIISIALFIMVAVIGTQLNNPSIDLSLAFASQTPKPLIEVTQRMLTESGWAGTGAGTFSKIVPIFRDMDESTIGQFGPTAAATIAVEMGRSFFWATALTMLTLAFILLRGALRRQRDFLYPTAGASCVIVVTLLGFDNSAPLTTSVSVIVATTIGMAIAQRKSRLV